MGIWVHGFWGFPWGPGSRHGARGARVFLWGSRGDGSFCFWAFYFHLSTFYFLLSALDTWALGYALNILLHNLKLMVRNLLLGYKNCAII